MREQGVIGIPYPEESLSSEEISILKQWIKQGAEWGLHWAYKPVTNPELPKPGRRFFGLFPPEKNDWVKNDLDWFVLDRLKKEGLMNPSTAYDFRTKILERGDLEDPAVMMKNFLGYESEGKAFFDHIHKSGKIDWFPPSKSAQKSTGGVESVAERGSILGCDQIFH